MFRSLFIRNLFFTILQPGIVAVLIPYLLLQSQRRELLPIHWNFLNYLGSGFIITGFIIMLTCIISFAREGKGTLSPVDPTKVLVIKGLYKYSRNPMYIGVMFILLGETVFYQSKILWAYAVIIFIAFNLFIFLHEEPRLRKDFGDAYKRYCKRVKRWI